MLGTCQASLSDKHGCAHKTGKLHTLRFTVEWAGSKVTSGTCILFRVSHVMYLVLFPRQLYTLTTVEDCALLKVVSFAAARKLCLHATAWPRVKGGVCAS